MVPKFIDSIMHGSPPPIFGNGLQSRDFTFVANVVEANILAARTAKVSGEVFNVACGSDTKVIDLVKKLNRIFGKKIKPQFLPVRQGDAFRTLADTCKIKKALGFKGKISFDEGLLKTVEYFRNKK